MFIVRIRMVKSPKDSKVKTFCGTTSKWTTKEILQMNLTRMMMALCQCQLLKTEPSKRLAAKFAWVHLS